MKKFLAIVLCLVCVLSLAACKQEGDIVISSKYVNFEVVEITANGRVIVDEETGVLYLWYKDLSNYGQTLTPLYNDDGTLKNIADFE